MTLDIVSQFIAAQIHIRIRPTPPTLVSRKNHALSSVVLNLMYCMCLLFPEESMPSTPLLGEHMLGHWRPVVACCVLTMEITNSIIDYLTIEKGRLSLSMP